MRTSTPEPKSKDSDNGESGREIIDPGPRAPHCQERSRLAEQYEATIEAYTESIRAMMDLKDLESGNAFQRLLEARNACETRRTALVDHEQQHRCAGGLGASA